MLLVTGRTSITRKSISSKLNATNHIASKDRKQKLTGLQEKNDIFAIVFQPLLINKALKKRNGMKNYVD